MLHHCFPETNSWLYSARIFKKYWPTPISMFCEKGLCCMFSFLCWTRIQVMSLCVWRGLLWHWLQKNLLLVPIVWYYIMYMFFFYLIDFSSLMMHWKTSSVRFPEVIGSFWSFNIIRPCLDNPARADQTLAFVPASMTHGSCWSKASWMPSLQLPWESWLLCSLQPQW